MTEHKTDMNMTEKLNNTSTAEYKTDMNMTEKLSSTFRDATLREHNYTLANLTINIRECLQVVSIRLSDFLIPIKVLLRSSTLGFDKIELYFAESNSLYTIQYNSY